MKKPSLLDLRPCQFVLGMKEVEDRIAKMRAFKKAERRAYLAERVIPLIRGPERELYIIDHHHLARACWELDVSDYNVRVIEDLSRLSEGAFWNKMIARDWVYLHDQFGLGPHLPGALPADIRGLADDPYRSLVWAVIKTEGICKERIPFFEFKWAEFFRRNVPGRLTSKSDFSDAIDFAAKLARTEAADHLPGFVGKRKRKKKKR